MIMSEMKIVEKVCLVALVLMLGCCKLVAATADCNCGETWDLSQCEIKFGGCGPNTHASDVIPGKAANVKAQYYIKGDQLGIKVIFNAPQERAALARMFDVTVIAQDYPVGLNECIRVKLDTSVQLNANHSFSLSCLNTRDLVPRQRFGITVQPFPTDGDYSNRAEIEYQMPGCRVIGPALQSCDNYDNPRYWLPRFKPFVVPDSCNGACITVAFDTFLWPNDDNVSTYKISACPVNPNTGRAACAEYFTYVSCLETLLRGQPLCNHTFYDLEPDIYVIHQQVYQDNGNGNVIIGDVIKEGAQFTVEDPGKPQIVKMPESIKIYVNNSNDNVTVTWTPPSVFNYLDWQVTLTSTHEPGEQFSVGRTKVTYTAVDKKGRTSSEDFYVEVIGPPTVPPPLESTGASSEKQKLILGAAAGGVTAFLLLLFIVFLKWKNFLKRGDQSSLCSDSGSGRTPTETTDHTPYHHDRDHLVDNTAPIDGSRIPCSSEYQPGADNGEDEFKCIADDYSINGQVFGPQPTSAPPRGATVTVHINTGPSPTSPGTATTWVSVDNDQTLQSIEPENTKPEFDYSRLNSCDSGIGEFPNTDEIKSISQIPYTEAI